MSVPSSGSLNTRSARRERAQVRTPHDHAVARRLRRRNRRDIHVRDERVDRARLDGAPLLVVQRVVGPLRHLFDPRAHVSRGQRARQRFDVVHGAIELLQLRVLRVDRSGHRARRASAAPRRIQNSGSRCASVTPMTPCAGICGSRGADGARCERQNCDCDEERLFHGARADSTFAMNSPMPVPRISPSMASSTAIGTRTGV